MTDDRGSPTLTGVHRTAIGAAVARASHLWRDGEPKILRDEFAVPLSGLSQEEAVAMSAAFWHTSAGWVLRSRYTEDRLAVARTRLNQYVILGAGLDSYALRHAADLNELNVFEVDDAPVQAWKQARLKALGLQVPRQLRFAPCDFERQSLADALADAGFASKAPAFIRDAISLAGLGQRHPSVGRELRVRLGNRPYFHSARTRGRGGKKACRCPECRFLHILHAR